MSEPQERRLNCTFWCLQGSWAEILLDEKSLRVCQMWFGGTWWLESDFWPGKPPRAVPWWSLPAYGKEKQSRAEKRRWSGGNCCLEGGAGCLEYSRGDPGVNKKK